MNRLLMALIAVLTIGLMSSAVHPAAAQGGKMSDSKMAAKKTYYVCAKCKVYYSEAAAKKVMYKDPMGHKLTKSAAIPKGYKDGGAMKKADKMGKM